MLFFRFLLSVGVLFGLSPTLSAADREATFPQWSQAELVPWFQSQPDQFILSKVPSQQAVRLRYKAFPRKDARGQVTIVHGYGERIDKLMEMAYDIHQAGFSVFLYDQRGFGRSTRLNPEGGKAIYVERFSDYVQDLEQFMTEVVGPERGQRPNFIFAHSMGGLVSAYLLHDRPDLVTAAVFSAPMLSIKTRGVPKRMALILAEIAEHLNFGATYAFGQKDPQPPEFATAATQSKPRWQFYADFYTSAAEWPAALGGTSFHWLAEGLRSTRAMDSEAWAAAITTPLLIFQADQDTYVDSEAQDAFCLRAKDCRKFFVPGSRHEIYREQDSLREPYMLSLIQFFIEHVNAGPNPATPRP